MTTATQNYTEDYVLDMLLNEDENSNFFGHRHHVKKQAKRDLKMQLRKKYGKGWWLPGRHHKYKQEYKNLKHKVIDEALKKASDENFEEREERKKIKAERKDKRTLEMQQKEFNQQMQMQQQIGMQNAQNNIGANASPENEKPKKDNKKMFLYIGIAVFVVIAGIVTVVLIKKHKE